MVVVGPEAAGARCSDTAWLGSRGRCLGRERAGARQQWRWQGAREAEREAVAAEELDRR